MAKNKRNKKQLRRDLVLMETERDQALERLEDCQAENTVSGLLLEAVREDLATEQAARSRDAAVWEDQLAAGLAHNERLVEQNRVQRLELLRAKDAATMEANTLRDTITATRADLQSALAERDEAQSQARQYAEAADRLIREQRQLRAELGQDTDNAAVEADLLNRATRLEGENEFLRRDIHAIAEALGMADDPYEPGGAERLIRELRDARAERDELATRNRTISQQMVAVGDERNSYRLDFLSLQAQIDKLASFIMDEVPGEPSQNEGAVDTAIRLLRSACTVADRDAPEVVVLGTVDRSTVDLLRPAVQAMSRALGRPVLLTATAPGNVVRIARQPIAMPGEPAPSGYAERLEGDRTRPPSPPVGQSVPFFAPGPAHQHACKAQPEDWKRCRTNPEAHAPHDWWDDHEIDPTRWHCAGAPLADGPAGPIPCAAEPHFAPPSAEQLADEGYIAQTTYDEPSDPQRAKVAELAELLDEVDEELDERGASRLAEPLAVATADELATLQRNQEARIVPAPTDELSEAVLEHYEPLDETSHDPTRTTDATELTAAIEQLAEDEGIVDGFAAGALVRDWLEGQRDAIRLAIVNAQLHGANLDAITDDVIDALAPPPSDPTT